MFCVCFFPPPSTPLPRHYTGHRVLLQEVLWWEERSDKEEKIKDRLEVIIITPFDEKQNPMKRKQSWNDTVLTQRGVHDTSPMTRRLTKQFYKAGYAEIRIGPPSFLDRGFQQSFWLTLDVCMVYDWVSGHSKMRNDGLIGCVHYVALSPTVKSWQSNSLFSLLPLDKAE